MKIKKIMKQLGFKVFVLSLVMFAQKSLQGMTNYHLIRHDELLATFWKYGVDLEGEWKKHVARYMVDEGGHYSEEKYSENSFYITRGLEHLREIIALTQQKHLSDLTTEIASKRISPTLITKKSQGGKSLMATQLRCVTLDEKISQVQYHGQVDQSIINQWIEGVSQNSELTIRRPIEEREKVFKARRFGSKATLTPDLLLNMLYAQLQKIITEEKLFHETRRQYYLRTSNQELLLRFPNYYFVVNGDAQDPWVAVRIDEDICQNNLYKNLDWFSCGVASLALSIMSAEQLVPQRSRLVSVAKFPFVACYWTIRQSLRLFNWSTQTTVNTITFICSSTGRALLWGIDNANKIAVPVLLFLIWKYLQEHEGDTNQVDYQFITDKLIQELQKLPAHASSLSSQNVTQAIQELSSSLSPQEIITQVQGLLDQLPRENITEAVEVLRSISLSLSQQTGLFPTDITDNQEDAELPVPEDNRTSFTDYLWQNLQNMRV